ncbi:MAG: alpha/beta hydrolase-fold protein [Planctomycetota bacterium]
MTRPRVGWPTWSLLLVAAACRAPESTAPEFAFLHAATFTLESKALGELRRVNVYTPPGYRENAAAYPVLYMPDGGLEEDFVHVAEAVHAGIVWSKVRPMLVVGVENTARRRDLTGPTAVASDREIAPRVGGSAAFRAFLRDELMPAIAARYRVTGESGLIGESLAGLFVVETFLLEPVLFDHYLAFSPSLWWNDRQLARSAEASLRRDPSLRASLYLTTADEQDIVVATRLLAEALVNAAPPGLVWTYQPMPEQFHDTIFRASAPRALRTVFAPAVPPVGGGPATTPARRGTGTGPSGTGPGTSRAAPSSRR